MGRWDLSLEIDAIGFDHAERNLEGYADRIEKPDLLYAMDAYESAEERHFAQFHGKYVRTGKLFDSYTTDNGDAIREAHGTTGEFGTRVQYARAAASRGGNWLLVIDKRGHREFTERLLNSIMHGEAGL